MVDPGTETFSYDWQVTKDGSAYASGNGTTLDFTPDDEGTYEVTLTVTDGDGGVGTDTATIVVNNVAPTIVLSGATNVDEGASYGLTLGTITDPGADTVTQWIVDWGDGTPAETFASGGLKNHTYADGGNTYTIQVDLVDEDGTHINAGSKTITVDNVDPVVSIGGAPASSDEGTPISLTSSVVDPGTETFSYDWQVTKDGSAYASGNGTTLDFTPDDEGTYEVTLTVTDGDGGVGTDTATIVVNNVAPTIVLSGATNVDEGASYGLTLGTITDPGADTVTQWIVDWGDGTPAETFASGGLKNHTYADGGNTYTIQVDLVDEDGTHINAGSKTDHRGQRRPGRLDRRGTGQQRRRHPDQPHQQRGRPGRRDLFL